MTRLFFLLSICSFAVLSCKKPVEKLPILGRTQIIDGKEVKHTIRDFSFVNQDSTKIDNDALNDNIYLADFFFTSCPTICPKVTKQMLRLYDRYEKEDLIKLVSFTIDPKRDDVARLKLYADNLEVGSDKWHFLTGDKDQLLDLAEDFFVVAYEDESVPGGFDHSGKIVMIDKNGHVRGFAEGTDPESVTDLFDDVDNLLNEVKSN